MSIATPEPDTLPTPELTRVVAVVGPTAVGKSRLAEDLALTLGGEVISADSMQVYRGMDIGTAKPVRHERRAPHHCIDLVDPGVPFSAALYQTAARDAIADISGRGAIPIVAGGTGLYVRAALDDWEFPAGDAASPMRRRLEADARLLGSTALHDRLRALDPSSAALIHPDNVRRTVRALEMAEEGSSYAQQAARFSRRLSIYDARFLGLTVGRQDLYQRIDARVDAMMAAGLLEEVRALVGRGFRDALTAAQAIGYKELVPTLETGADPDEAVAAIKQASRRYAKRQIAWFRADERISWIDVTDFSHADILTQALCLLESPLPSHTGRPAPESWRLTGDPSQD